MKCFEGDKVVVSTSTETVVYTVKAVNNNYADLQYRHGNHWVGGGTMPTSMLMRPSAVQLEAGKHYLL